MCPTCALFGYICFNGGHSHVLRLSLKTIPPAPALVIGGPGSKAEGRVEGSKDA